MYGYGVEERLSSSNKVICEKRSWAVTKKGQSKYSKKR